MSKVVIYGFETSNNFKVRIALGFKGIDYRFETIDPSDRGEIVRISGQPFTPVMVHGDTVMFDSGAILRYLEANFTDTPKLFSKDYFTMRSIEEWEAFGRVTLHEPLWTMVRQRITGVSDDNETARATELFAEATAKLEAVLSDNEWLAHTRMTAADVTAVGVIRRVQDLEPFELPEDRPHMYAWVERVGAFDPGPGD
jgi:glutathione S-transferase